MDFEKQNQDYYNSSDYKLQFESSKDLDGTNNTQKSCWFRYKEKLIKNDDIILYLKVFTGLIIQCLLVIFFVWLGFATGASDAFIKSSGAIIATLIIVSIYILILCYSTLCLKYETNWFYLHAISYIPCMVFYCYEISGATDKTNIYIVLFSIFLDIFSIFIYLLSFMSLNFIGLILFPLISNIIAIIIFSFTILYNDPGLIGKIIAIDISAIIYFNIIFFVLKINIFNVHNYFECDEYIVVIVIFDLAIFSPVAFILFVIFVIFLIYIFGTSEINK
jgi:hypothetical protein